jgi:hypothetical protein
LKYGELVQFDPIESVIELRDAGQTAKARQLVSTYVISDSMARQLADTIAAHLDFANLDAKGIFVVGNYGTGKSHLMAVVSSVAENAEMLEGLGNEQVQKAFGAVAGRYLVARIEIGAVKTPLRDIVVRELEKNLKAWGVSYAFPPADQLTNHKDAIEHMLAAVEAAHSGKGVLVVIDELLDYLRALGEGAISAFNFLRELGEAAGNGRFRVIAGVQESLISSPSFGFLASLVQKVSARFVEVWITRQDLAFVVENRLLAKRPEQRERIREHLEQFMPLFPTMSAEREGFIRLFPVHPRYLEVFENIEIAEKREVLRTLSHEMSRLLGEDVPEDDPGLIAYDSYWRVINATPSYLATPAVGEVEQKSSIVASKIATSLPKAQYRPAANRIVDALSVYRLAVGGIRSSIGLSATDLRDDLALMLPVPERDPDFLNTTIESVLHDIQLAVNGQFISRNESGQYYLDLDKTIDYEAQVDRKVATLEPVPERFDVYYFDLLTRVLEMTGSTHVPGMRIWAYEVEWSGHRVKRPGYLFFGSPNERSTAKPPRTFYIYFLAQFAPTPFEDARRDDEVFFRLARPAPEVIDRLKKYAAATELQNVSSGEEKAQYLALAERHRREAAKWLAENLVHAFEITHAGVTKPVGVALAGPLKTTGTSTPRDLIDTLASTVLAPSFERRFPDYPSFTSLPGLVTEESRAQTATEGLRFIAGSIKTEQGGAVVDGLRLRDDGAINPVNSPYAAVVRNALAAKPEGHVVNRGELIVQKDGVEFESSTAIEPEWLAVVLFAMAYRGEIEIATGSLTIDATNLVQGAALGAEAVARFKTIQKPKETPIAALKDLFELLGLNPSLLDVNQDEAASQLQSAVALGIEDVLAAKGKLPLAQLGGTPLWPQPEANQIDSQLEGYRAFLDRLRNLNTAGRLKQYKTPPEELAAQKDNRARLNEVKARLGRLREIETLDEYLRDATATFLPDDAWQAVAVSARERVRDALPGTDAEMAAAKKSLMEARATYVAKYLDLHGAARLDYVGDEAKKRVMSGDVLRRLNLLESVQMLPAGLGPLKTRLADLKMCRSVDERELESVAFCRACHFKPSLEPQVGSVKQQLGDVEAALENLNHDWSSFIVKALEDATAKAGLDLLGEERASAVRSVADPAYVPHPSAIQDLNRVLQGLQKVVIEGDSLLAALRTGGPATTVDLEDRFRGAVDAAVKSKDPAKVRLVIE